MSERIAVLGVGRIGAVTATGLAHLGHAVRGIDRSETRLEHLSAGNLPEREPGLRSALRSALRFRDLTFSRQGEAGQYSFAFLCVDTPPLPSGEPDLSQVFGAATDAAPLLRAGGILVTRSTVPVGTGDRLSSRLAAAGRADVRVVHAPEFLREGRAWEDFREPDRLVFGGDGEAAERVADLFDGIACPVFVTDRRTAELAKYAANAFLATTISFANEMADLCAAVEVDSATVFQVLKADRRVGPHAYLTPGLGFGGHCLPKDTAALEHLAAGHGQWMPQLHATRTVNRGRIGAAVAWLRVELGGLDGRRVCLAGLSFKSGTDDLRESPALHLARALQLEGVEVAAYDPEAALPSDALACADTLLDAARGADALVFTHNDPAWRGVATDAIAEVMAGRLVFDAPGVLDPEPWLAAGFKLNRVARPLRSAPRAEAV